MSERSSRATTRACRRARVNLWDPLTIGIDIGGTKILAGVVDSSGTRGRAPRRPDPGRTTGRGREHDRRARPGAPAARTTSPRSVSAPPASSTPAGRTVMFSPHLAWRDEPLRARWPSRIPSRSSWTTTPTPPPGPRAGSAPAPGTASSVRHARHRHRRRGRDRRARRGERYHGQRGGPFVGAQRLGKLRSRSSPASRCR